METQKEIAQEIIEGGRDYILRLKENQGNIHQGDIRNNSIYSL